MKTLTIRLAAPLQSYGDRTSFSRRTTNDYPTKSAVIGLLAAALGYRRDDSRITDLNALAFAVRIDQAGVPLTDYQTVEWKPDTRKVTYRDYLQDAVYMIAVGSDDSDLIERLHFALQHPRFQLFFGRRANVPAGVLKIQEFDDDPVSVLKTLTWQAAPWYQRKQKKMRLPIYADAALISTDHDWMVCDTVKSFDSRHREHGFRTVNQTSVLVTNERFDSRLAKPTLDYWPFG